MILTKTDLDPNIRQAAGVQLKRYVTHHWVDEDNEDFLPPAVPEGDREAIRGMLPPVLLDPSSKLRTAAV